MDLGKATDQELLYELMQRSEVQGAPVKIDRSVPFVSSFVEINEDHMAEISMPEEDWDILQDLMEK